MNFARTFIFAPALTLMLAGNAAAEDPPAHLGPLYQPFEIVANLRDPKIAKELKMTKEQEKVFKSDTKHFTFPDTPKELEKLKGAEKEAKRRAFMAKKADENFAWAGKTLRPEQIKRLKQVMLRAKGMQLFDHPEIRELLKIDAAMVKDLKAAHEKAMVYYVGEINAGRISREEGRKIYNTDLGFGVPEKVREQLNDEQRKKLQDLLGEPYTFNS